MKTNQDRLINPDTEKKIDALLSEMTIEEKIGQLHQVGPSPVGGFEISQQEKKNMLLEGRITSEEYDRLMSEEAWDNQEDLIRQGKIGSFLGLCDAERCNHLQSVAVEQSRLGIPLLFGLDVIHGHQTVFPIPLAESCCFDDTQFELSAQIAAREASSEGINWTFAPMLDIARDARWGRIAEGAGEDTCLASRYAAAKVRGFQGNDLSAQDRILACAKHFVAYGAAVGGRDYNSVDISLQTLWNTYLPPFQAACNAGVATVMSAFNDVNGIPCTVNQYLLRTVLRQKLGFNGLVVSDAGSISECFEHGVVSGRKEVAQRAISAGVNIDMVSGCYTEHLKELVEEGTVPIETVDSAVREVLRVKYAKGLFDHPYVDVLAGNKILLCQEHRDAAREAAKRSIVLLKNEDILPLKKGGRIAVVGDLAENAKEMLGTWTLSGREQDTISLLQGLKNKGIDFVYVPCCGVEQPFDRSKLENAIKDVDVVIAAVGELVDMSGEASSLCNIDLHGEQKELIDALYNTGKPFVTLLFNGRPLAIRDVVEKSPAVLECWHLGTETGNAICDVLFGDYNPSGRLSTTYPNYSGECPIYYNHLNTGRPASTVRAACKYLDAPIKPLFPFGFGLSYTEYQYSNLKTEQDGKNIVVSVDVENIGEVSGTETVQFYVQDTVATRATPVRELKEYKKLDLKPHENAV